MTNSGRRWRAGGWLLALSAALLLAASCGGNDAVDVQPAKPDDEAPALVPADDNEPTNDVPETETPAQMEPPAGEPIGVRPVETVEPEERSGWRRISPSADMVSVTTGGEGQNILGGAAGAGWLSTDGGRTWARLDWPGDQRSRAIVGVSALDIVVAGFAPASGIETAAVLSDDAGFTWSELELEAPAVSWYVLDSFLYAIPGLGLLATNDGGATSTLLGEPGAAWPPDFSPIDVRTNPLDLDGFMVVSHSEGGAAAVQVTADRGETYAALVQGFDLWGVTVPAYTSIGPMVMSQGVGVLMSFDQGATWTTQNAGLEGLAVEGRYPSLVDFVWLRGASRPILASDDTLYAFDPAGWRAYAGPGATIRDLVVLPAVGEDPEQVLAATDEGIWAIPASELR